MNAGDLPIGRINFATLHTNSQLRMWTVREPVEAALEIRRLRDALAASEQGRARAVADATMLRAALRYARGVAQHRESTALGFAEIASHADAALEVARLGERNDNPEEKA